MKTWSCHDVSRYERRGAEAEGTAPRWNVSGMAHRLRHYPSQSRAVSSSASPVARALVGDPLILMADEPTGNLDSRMAKRYGVCYATMHRNGATVCMVTHDQRYAKFRRTHDSPVRRQDR